MLQQNRKYSRVSGNFAAAKLVKLAAILPQRKNSQVSSNFACSEQFCSRLFLALIYVIAHKKMTINNTITSFQRHLQPTFNKKFRVSGNVCRLFFLLLHFFLSGCDRFVENDDECCNRTFLDHILPMLWKMLQIFFTVLSGCERYRKQILMPFYPTRTKVPCQQ